MIRSISPIDGSLVAQRPVMTIASAGDAVTVARNAQPAWAACPLARRLELVLRGIEKLGAMNDKIVLELAWQMGRPVRYGGEFATARARARHMGAIAARALAPSEVADSPGFKRFITRAPLGLVFVIAPWNHPFVTALNTIVPALIAGNTVMLKHASQTLLAGERLAQAFAAAGLPEGVFQNVVLSHDSTTALIGAGSFDHISFTGSLTSGQQIERAAAGTFTGNTMDVGAKDAAYVMEGGDVARAANALTDGALLNAGQSGNSIERVYVARSVYPQFVALASARAARYRLGNPLDPETTLGPMARDRFADHVRTHVREALDAGARAHVDPAAFPMDQGRFVMPQVLSDVDHTMRLMREPSFGPVFGIMPVDDDDAAIRLLNDSEHGLNASLWGGDVARAQDIGAGLATEAVSFNQLGELDPAWCRGGCRNTERGGTLSVIGYHRLTRTKSFFLNKD